MPQEELGTLQFNYLVLTQKVISNSSSPAHHQNAGEPAHYAQEQYAQIPHFVHHNPLVVYVIY